MGEILRIFAFHGFLVNVGGAEKAFASMLLGLRDRGHEITLWTLNISDYYSSWLRQKGISVNTFGMERSRIGRRPLTLTNDMRAKSRFSALVKRLGPVDVAFIHHYDYSPLLAPKLARKGIPVVYYCQEPPRHYYEPDLQNVTAQKKLGKAIGSLSNWMDKRMDRAGVEHVDQILTNSDYSREYVWRTYDKKPRTVYLGVDLERFHNLGLDKENMVLAVGGNYYLKAHDFIVRSLGRVPREIRPRLTVIGKGDRQSDFRQLAKENGVEVEMVENASDERVVELYNRAKATVIAYVMEPFGLVAIESMACETPVIAVREGGLRESVTEETGWLTDRNEEDFAAAVISMLKDPEGVKAKGQKGRQRVERQFSWGRCAAELEKILLRWSRKGRMRAGS
jgi:glycosyltransferase involved in cell wall biosynthesis